MNERIIMFPNDINIIDKNGNKLKGNEAKQYLEQQKKIKIQETIPLNYKIKLQRTNRIVIIKSNDGTIFKYIGIDPITNEQVVFNQEDIEEIIE